MEKTKNKFTLKIILSYLLLILLATIASFYIFSEIKDYVSNDSFDQNEVKLLKTSTLLSSLYEAEGLSKLAIQSPEKKNLNAYSQKIDSIFTEIETLIYLSESEYQDSLLNSLCFLLEKKVANNDALRKLRVKNQTGKSINHALDELTKMEASLGIITAENLAPNLENLPPKAQESIRKMASYLNENIPSDGKEVDRSKKIDSILQISKDLLKEIRTDNTTKENSLTSQELKINKTDMELSQQLRNIITNLEKEILANSINDNINKEAALKRSTQLAVIAALLGFLVVGIFTFIINRDFWKANLYRQKLEKEKKYSESLLKSREQLITTVSHDLRTPLNTITGYSEIMEKTGLSPEQNQYITQIKSASFYVNNLVNDLLDFSRLEAGKINIEKTPFNLSQLIKETTQNLSDQYANKDISLNLDVSAEFGHPILGDPVRMRQIINNLLGNAFKFTEKGSITIKADLLKKAPSENWAQIQITDTGIGISKEKQELIFNEFTQAEIGTEKKYGGYGLGLTISKKIVELLGGEMTLKSTVGHGSTFSIMFPVIFEKATISQIGSSRKESYQDRFGILIIDDDSSFIRMIGEYLKSENIEPILCTDFETLPKNGLEYEVVLTDIEMPSTTGFEVLTRLKSGKYGHYCGQPIIAMTGRKDLKEQLFLSHGFHTVLQKPFSNTALLNAVTSLKTNKEMVKHPTIAKSLKTEEKHPLYSLKILRSFLGDDEKSINEILYTFIADTEKNLQKLKDAVRYTDYDLSQKIAHKMLPMFRQLKATPCVNLLDSLENDPYGSLDLNKTYEDLKPHISALLKALNERLAKHPDHIG